MRTANTRPAGDNVARPPSTRFGRVALLAAEAGALPALAAALRAFAEPAEREVIAWIEVQRFRAPPTHPPYRALALMEARRITAEAVARAEKDAGDAAASWSRQGWRTRVEALVDPTAADIAGKVLAEEVDLLISDPCLRMAGGLVQTVTALTQRPVLVVPARPEEAPARRGLPAVLSGRLRLFQG